MKWVLLRLVLDMMASLASLAHTHSLCQWRHWALLHPFIDCCLCPFLTANHLADQLEPNEYIPLLRTESYGMVYIEWRLVKGSSEGNASHSRPSQWPLSLPLISVPQKMVHWANWLTCFLFCAPGKQLSLQLLPGLPMASFHDVHKPLAGWQPL